MSRIKYHHMVNTVVPVFFLVMLLISGIYVVPYLDVPEVPYLVGVAGLAFGKQILFVCLMVMMGSTFRWREVIGTRFTLLCCIWLLIHMVHWLLRREYDGTYLHRIVQIAFIWVFVNYIIQQREEDRKPFLGLQVLSYQFFSIFCILVVTFSFNAEVARLIVNGFGGNRFGFSIWLSQFVFLTFFIHLNLNSKNKSILIAIIWVTPILILQIFTGGRTGILASFVIFLYFAYQQGGFRVFILSVPYLATVIFFSNNLSNMIGTSSGFSQGAEGGIGLSIFRVNDAIFSEYNLQHRNVADRLSSYRLSIITEWVDRLSSFRLSIITDAFSRADTFSLFFGNGVENFMGKLPTGSLNHVHNIYLRALGEIGVIGFATLIAMMALPFRIQLVNLYKCENVLQKNNTTMLVYCSVVILVGMLHSEYITTGLSTCMIFWLCYAETIRVQTAT